MKQFLETLVKNIVDNPDKVEIEESVDGEGRTVFMISVDDGDMGRVIGKAGKVINSIRTIMRIMAIRQDAHIRVDVKDSGAPAPTEEAEASEPEVEADIVTDDEILVETEETEEASK